MNKQKYLFLNFENAGCFPKKVNGSGFIKPDDFKPNGENRTDIVFDDALINVNHISNVLHVLCGLHPVPSLYKTKLERDETIYKCASNAMIKFKKDFKPNEKGYYNSEFMQGKKTKITSHKDIVQQILIKGEVRTITGVHNWRSWRRYLKTDELYNRVVSLFSDVCLENNIKNYTLIEIIEKFHSTILTDIQKDFLNVLLVDIKAIKKTPICDILSGKSFDAKGLNQFNSNYPITNISSVKKILRLDGYVMIPITDKILDMIKLNSGTATILDGGFIYIDEILDSIDTESLCDSGWNKVKEGWKTNTNNK